MDTELFIPSLPSHILLLVTELLVQGLWCFWLHHLPHEEDTLGAGGIYHQKEWPVEFNVRNFVPSRFYRNRGNSDCCSLCASFIHIQGGLVDNLREKSLVSQLLHMYRDDSCHS